MKEAAMRLALVAVSCCSLLGCASREEKLIAESNRIIARIENYKRAKGHLPASLSVMGIPETEEGPVYYQQEDSTSYIVWFGMSVGESVTYHSKTKNWKED